MSNAEIPHIKSLPESVTTGVGKEVEIFIHGEDTEYGPPEQYSHDMVSDVVRQTFAREGVPPNRDLEVLCILTARIAVAKLATAPGFTVKSDDNRQIEHPKS